VGRLQSSIVGTRLHRYTINFHWKRKQSGQLPGVADHALQTTDCVRQHKLSEVVLVAHSYGGVPAMQDAAGKAQAKTAWCTVSALSCKVQVTICTQSMLPVDGLTSTTDRPS